MLVSFLIPLQQLCSVVMTSPRRRTIRFWLNLQSAESNWCQARADAERLRRIHRTREVLTKSVWDVWQDWKSIRWKKSLAQMMESSCDSWAILLFSSFFFWRIEKGDRNLLALRLVLCQQHLAESGFTQDAFTHRILTTFGLFHADSAPIVQVWCVIPLIVPCFLAIGV